MIKNTTFNQPRIYFIFMAFFLFGNLNAQTVIFEEQFDGGIDSTWQINPLTCFVPDSLHNTLWEWSADGTASTGAYWSPQEMIQSPSVANGCALFNSDFLDTNGMPDSVNIGLSPAPHSAELVSPIIDCSLYPALSLQFHQSYRGLDSETSIEVSGDGGVTWTPFIVNQDAVPNEGTPAGDIETVNITSVAGGSSTVQVKFVFSGRYYFWLVDDVQLIVNPDTNLDMPLAAFSVLYGTPITQRVSMEIDAEVCNIGSAETTNTNLTCAIVEAGGNILYEESFLREDPFPIDSCEVMVIPTQFDMEALELPVGTYDMTYIVTSDEPNSGNTNSQTHEFTVTENVLRKTRNTADGGLTVSGGGAFEFGYQFYIPNENDKVLSADFRMTAGNGSSMAGESVTIKIYEVGPEPLDGTMEADDLSIKAGGSILFDDTYANYSLASVQMEDIIGGGDGFVLEEATYYLAMIAYSGTETVFAAINESVDFGFTNAIHDVIIDGDGQLFAGGFQGADRIPIIDLNLVPADFINVEEVVESFKVNLFPNPANQQVQLELNLDETVNHMNIQITDAFGKEIENRNYNNIQNETLSFNTKEYAPGTYLLFIRSDNKVQTQKFVIVH